jgi:hypothetical protein
VHNYILGVQWDLLAEVCSSRSGTVSLGYACLEMSGLGDASTAGTSGAYSRVIAAGTVHLAWGESMRRRTEDSGGGARKPVTAPAALSVGARVRTPLSTASGTAGEGLPVEAGVIVDDFGESLVPEDHYGRDWAITKRWAIALDSGSLVFRNDHELERET